MLTCILMIFSIVHIPTFVMSANSDLVTFQSYALSNWIKPVYTTYLTVPSTGRAFGASRSNGRKHAGMDYYVRNGHGTPVYAMTSGTVVEYSSNFYASTQAIGVKNDDGSVLRYCEIATPLRVGSRVEQGEQIGTIKANTAGGGTMLHLELYMGTVSGSLSNKSNRTYNYVSGNFQRRRDLLNPEFLLSLGGTPPNPVKNPELCVDICQGGNGSVRVRGWAFDEDDTSVAIPVHVYIGGPAGSANAEGYAITADQYRDDVNAVYNCGNYHGFDAIIPTSKTGYQEIYIYACNIGGGSTQVSQESANIVPVETEPPTITNARITDITNMGYTVKCNVTDKTGVSRVQFVTWSDANGQDDIAPNWEVNPIVSGNKNSDGEYEFHVNISDHIGNRGLYSTHIYAYDVYGNRSGVPLTVTIPGYDYCFDKITLGDNNLSINGWATAINGFSSLKATLTDTNGKSINYDITDRYYREDIETFRPGWNNSKSGFKADFDISSLAVGSITMKITGITDNVTYTLRDKTIPYKDTEPPVITDARIVDITNYGYTVLCKVKDNQAINRVQFVTWSDANGQDDIAPDWEQNPVILGTKNSNGEYEFHVDIKDHDSNRGLYYTHIYAFDNSGNASMVPLTPIVPGYDFNSDKITIDGRNLYVKGWATSINGIDNLKAVVTDRDGTKKSYDITNRYERDDITALRPGWNTKNAGYEQTIDLTGLSAGDAIVEITGELYQEDMEKATYTLGKKVIELPDNLQVNISLKDNMEEYTVGEAILFNVNQSGAQSCKIYINNERGSYNSFNIGNLKGFMQSFDTPGTYSICAEAIGLNDTLKSETISFTVIEDFELEPDAEDTDGGATPAPTVKPTIKPTVKPTAKPTATPTIKPTATSTSKPTTAPITYDRVEFQRINNVVSAEVIFEKTTELKQDDIWLIVAYKKDGVLKKAEVPKMTDMTTSFIIPAAFADCDIFVYVWDKNMKPLMTVQKMDI